MAHRKKPSPAQTEKSTPKPPRSKAAKRIQKQPDKNPDTSNAISLYEVQDLSNLENAVAKLHNHEKTSGNRPFCIPVKDDSGNWHCYYRIGPDLLQECNRIGPFKTKTQCERTICPCSA